MDSDLEDNDNEYILWEQQFFVTYIKKILYQ